VYDNEQRVPAGEQALTLPEVMATLSGEIFKEISPSSLGSDDPRRPVISNFRRGLQADYADRLIAVSTGKAGLPRVARQLSALELRGLKARLDATVAKATEGNCDPYTRAHLADLQARTDAALQASIEMQ
jgi:hypothetical protein